MNKIPLLLFVILLSSCKGSTDNTTQENPITSQDVITNASTNENNYLIDGVIETPMSTGEQLSPYQFNLKNNIMFSTSGADSKITSVWDLGYTGKGINIAVVDTGIDINHEDLFLNIKQDKAVSLSPDGSMISDSAVSGSVLDHGTAVAGIIASINNDIGTIGVSYDSEIIPIRILGDFSITDFDISDINTGNINNVDFTEVDIYNKSFGFLDPYHQGQMNDFILSSLESSTKTLRGGKGAVHFISSGNDYDTIQGSGESPCNYSFDFTNEKKPCTDTTHSTEVNNPYEISVASVNVEGKHSFYSNYGSSNWVSSLSSGYGAPNPNYNYQQPYFGVVSTSQSGCFDFYNSNTIEYNADKICNYTSNFGGTSASSPVLSGVASLMLEANPNLTWLDVKDIIARSSSIVDRYDTIKKELTQHYGEIIWDYGWIRNSAGFKFNNRYGFGLVNAEKAISLATTRDFTMGNTLFKTAQTNSTAKTLSTNGNETIIEFNVLDDVKINAIELDFLLYSLLNEGYYDRNTQVLLENPQGIRTVVKSYGNSYGKSTNLVYTGSPSGNYHILVNSFYEGSSKGKWKLIFKDYSEEDNYFKSNTSFKNNYGDIFEISNSKITFYYANKKSL